MSQLHEQDPDERLDYSISYVDRLPAGDNLASSVWTVPAGLTGSSESISGQIATLFLTGGLVDIDYVVQNRSVSAAGRIVEDFIVLRIRNSA